MDCKKLESDIRRGLRCMVCAKHWDIVNVSGGRVYGKCKFDARARSAKVGSANAEAMLAIYAAREVGAV